MLLLKWSWCGEVPMKRPATQPKELEVVKVSQPCYNQSSAAWGLKIGSRQIVQAPAWVLDLAAQLLVWNHMS